MASIVFPAPRRRRPPMTLVLAAVVAAVAVAIPIVYVVVRAAEEGWGPIQATLWRARTLQMVARSLGLAAAVTGAGLVIGIGAAWLVARTDLPGRRVWQVVLGLPLAMPSYVAAWGWIGWDPDLAGPLGAWIVLTTISYPYVYFPVLGALRTSDPALEEAARSLGRSPWQVFARVTLPEVRIAAVGGALLVGLYVLSDFGAVSIMRFEVLTQSIYRSYRSSFDRTPAAVLACVLVVLSLVLVAAAMRLHRRAAHRVGAGALRPAAPIHLGRWKPVAVIGVVALLGAVFAVPLRSLVVWLERGRSSADWSQWWSATTTTLLIAVVAALVTVAVAVPISILSARYPGSVSSSVTGLAYAGHALPGIVIALSLVFVGIRFATPLYQGTAMLVFAYVVLFLSLALGAVHHAIAHAPPVLDDMARSLGRSPWQAWSAVTLRLAAPGIGVAIALVCLTVMKELPATLLLRPIGTETLATRLWSHTSASSYAAAAPYAATILLLAAIPTAALSRVGVRDPTA
ncbi:MAG: ABC transporter permease [Ilumatobacteraceae bacterium]